MKTNDEVISDQPLAKTPNDEKRKNKNPITTLSKT